MPINNNVGVLNAYDRAEIIPVEFLGGLSDPSLHQLCAHCLAFEICRSWTREGFNKYNNDAQYDVLAPQIVDEALARVALNPATAASALQLTAIDKAIARQLGENYFEHGYVYILSGVDQNAKRNFRRDSGVSTN